MLFRIFTVFTIYLSIALGPAWSAPQEVKQLVLNSLKHNDVPAAAVAVIENHQFKWSLVVGNASPEQPATRATRFNVASMMKPVTAESVLRILSNKDGLLDQPMTSYWTDPDLIGNDELSKLTPRIALLHQTGFANWRNATNGKLKFAFTPGSKTQYSGEGYDYLARYLERHQKQTFNEILQSTLFSPLKMTSAGFESSRNFQDAQPYNSGQWGERHYSTPWSAADNLYLTVDDYAKFMMSVMKAEGLAKSIEKQRFNVVDNQITKGCPLKADHCPSEVGFGLGWEVLQYDDIRVIRHSGQDWGEQSMGFFVPETGFGLIVLTNGASGMKVIRDISKALYNHEAFNALLELQAR